MKIYRKIITTCLLILLILMVCGCTSATDPTYNSTNTNLTSTCNENMNSSCEQNILQEKVDLLSLQENQILSSSVDNGVYYVNSSATNLNPDGSVDNPYHNITSAVNEINDNTKYTGNYTINIASGTYTENSIEITKNITFNGNNTNGEIIVNGDQKRIFNSYSNTISINFNNLTLTNGSSSNGVGGMISISNGYINFTNCKIKSNTANSGSGGAIYLGTGNITIKNSNLTNNTANSGSGGAIYLGTGNISITNSNFTSNTGINYSGGAIYLGTGNISITNSNFTNNTVNSGKSQMFMIKNGGGAIYINKGNCNITKTFFLNNLATGETGKGGAISIGQGNLTLKNSEFVNNTANTTSGGAICVLEGNVKVTGSEFKYNAAEVGGAINIENGNLTINTSNFDFNNASYFGGAICVLEGNVNVNNTNFGFNNAAYFGGAIFTAIGTVNINNSNFNSNNASYGGALCIGYSENMEEWYGFGNVNCTNTVFTSNTANNGSVFYVHEGNASASNCVFVNNSLNTINLNGTSKLDSNWWGVNNPNFKENKLIFNENNLISPDNWVIMNLTIIPDSIFNYEKANVYVKFQINNTNGIVTDLIEDLPSRVLTLSSNGGVLNPSQYLISNNVDSSFTSNIREGVCTVFASIDNEVLNSTINVENPVSPVNPTGTILVGDNITCHPGNLNYTVTLKTVNGDVLGNESVLFILYDGEYHPVTTDSNGFATVTLNNLTIETYSIRYVYMGNNLYTSSNGESTITVTSSNVKVDPVLNVTYNDTCKLLSFNLTGNGASLSGENITVNIKGNNLTITTNKDGLASIDLNNYTSGIYTVSYYYLGTEDINGVNGSLNITITNTSDVITVLTLNNFTEFYGQGLNLTGKLLDLNGNPVIGQHISLNLTNPRNGLSKVYWVTTDTLGEYQLQINLFAGDYGVSASFNGNIINNTTYLTSGPVNASIFVNKTSTILSADKFNETYNAGCNFTGKLVDFNGNPISGEHISLNLSNPRNGLSKIYWVTTDVNGEYQLAINLFAGEYTACCSYFGTSQYEPSNVSTTISVTS